LAPVINCPANITVSSSANACGAIVNYAATETTAIPASTITYSIAPGSFFPVGTTTVTATATNAVGVSICSFTVTVVDDVPPIVITQNITVQLDANGAVSITPAQINNGSTDNCAIATYSLDKTSFDCSNVGANTVILTVTDVNGNVSNNTAIVTVEDKVAPTVITQNITVQLDANGAVSITPADINNGSTDNCAVATYSLDKTSFDCSNVGANTVILTVTDVNGNVSTATAIVTVEDKVAPTIITQNITVQLDANGAASITPAQINNGSTDNCAIAAYSLDKTSFDCSNVGTNTVTLTVTDVSGNSSAATAIVVVEDKVAPTVITKNITVQLDANGAVSITPADINNGSTDNCSIATYSLDKTSFDCSNTGANTVTLTLTDVNGNISSNTAIVTVEDKVAPIVITQNITVQLDANGAVSITPADVNNSSTDNCSIATYSLDKASFDCSNVGANTVTLTVTDVNGNVSTATAVVTVEDKVAPTVITQNITVQLDANGHASITPAQINNGSTDNCVIASYSLDKTGFDCSNVGQNIVTLTVTDVNGNTSSNTAVVTIEDHVPAVVLTNNITIQLSATGAASITVADINNGSNDACGIASMVLSKTSFDCSNVGNNTVTLTVTDVNGNVSSNTAVVTVKDEVPAVVLTRNITIQLNASGTASITAADVNNGSNDACGIAGMTVSPNVFTCANVGANTVTLTVTDVNGNISSNTAVVMVQDLIAPVVITKNITVNLDGTGHVSITAADVNNGSSDACGIASMSVSPNNFSCANLGANTVTLTVTDVNGNTSTKTAVVTVQDKLGPVPTVLTLPTVTGQCSANVVIVGSTCSDNCRCCRGGCHCHDNCRCHRNDNSWNNHSWNNWSWWWNNDDDDNDCDNDADDYNTYYMATPTAMDNCSGLIKGTTTDPLHYNTQGTYIINWKFVDANGNITIQPQTVIVNDNQAPIPWVNTLPTITGQCSVTVALTNNNNDDDDYEADRDDDHDGDNDHDHWNQHHRGAPWAWDNCAGWLRGTTTDPLTYSTQGTYIIHWKFNDGHGNITIQNQTVIVKDVTAPKPMVKNLPTLTGSCSVTVTTVPTAKDNCVGMVNGTTTSPLSYTAQGTYTIVWTYNDGRGNTSTQTQKVVVDDVTKPVPQVANLPMITGACSATVTTIPKANDNCKGVITGTTTDPLTYTTQGTYTIHWSYNDGNGNITTQNQTVVIDDITAPVPQVAVLPTLTGECSVTATAPKANDNCKGLITATTGDPLTYTRQGTYTIHWSYNDGNGNTSTQNQTVVISDVTKPTITAPAAATVSCGGSTAPTVNATATDNCSGAIAITYSDITSGNTITRTWKATDAAGNFSTSAQTLTIVDNTAPVITDPRDVTVSCGTSTDPSVTGRATAADNCSTVTVTYADITSGYTITRTWTAKDASNNTATSTQVITIVDNTKPTITDIADVTVNCGASTDPAVTGKPTASDNCSAVTITSSDVTSGNTIIRTWTAKDASGNTATSSQVITIGSLFSTTVSSVPTSSTYTGGVSTNLYLGYGAQSTTLQIGSLPSAGAPYSYAWSGTYTSKLSSTTSAAPVFTPTSFGYYTFNVTVTNKYGCTSSCSISICVTDVRVPGTNGAKIYVTHTPNGKNAVAQTLQVALSSVSSHIGSGSCGSNGNDRLGSTDQSPCNTTIANATGVTNSGTAKDGETAVTTSTEEDLKVTAMPNPTTTFFTLKIESRYQTPVELRVMDGRGRVVDAKSKIGANSTIQIGHNYSSGTYYAELIQGTQRKVVQLIKGRG
jgi:PKD repeat protein